MKKERPSDAIERKAFVITKELEDKLYIASFYILFYLKLVK